MTSPSANIFGKSSPKRPIINSDSVLKLSKPFTTPYLKEVERSAMISSCLFSLSFSSISFVLFSIISVWIVSSFFNVFILCSSCFGSAKLPAACIPDIASFNESKLLISTPV